MDSLGCATWVHNILTIVMTNIIVDKWVKTTLNHWKFVKFFFSLFRNCGGNLTRAKEKYKLHLNYPFSFSEENVCYMYPLYPHIIKDILYLLPDVIISFVLFILMNYSAILL